MDTNGYDEDEDWLVNEDYDLGPVIRGVAGVAVFVMSILPVTYLLTWITQYVWSFLHYAVPGAGQ